MVSIVKHGILALEVLLAVSSNVNASKCTDKEDKQLLAATPDIKSCEQFYTVNPGTMKDDDELCKNTACLASLKRMVAGIPECTNSDGDNIKRSFTQEFAYCDTLKTPTPTTKTPSSTPTTTPTATTAKPKTPTPITTSGTAEANTSETTSAPVVHTTAKPTVATTPAPTPKVSSSAAPVTASTALLGSPLVAVAFLMAN